MGLSSTLNQKIYKIQQIEELKDLNKFHKLVTKQNKKYGNRLLSHSDYYT